MGVGGVCTFCTFLYGSVRLDAGFCIHLVFLADKIAYKETQSSCYTQIVPWYLSHSEINSHFPYKC